MAVEEFKTRREKERQKVLMEMEKMLYETLRRVERGELSGIAIATVTVSGQPGYDWKGWNASTLGHAVSRLFHVFYRQHTEG